MAKEELYLAHFKYYGELVEDGFLDARKSAEALIGIDELLRYFLHQKSPELISLNFDLPVRTRRGCWETIIPENIGQWLSVIIGSGLTAYSISALKKMAQNDIGDQGFKDVFKSIIKSVKWIIQIGKHLKTLAIKKFDKVEIKELDGIQFIGIYNDENQLLFVPKEYLDIYSNIPETILGRLVKNVEEGREFKVGFSKDEIIDKDDTDNDAFVSVKEKAIFYKDKPEVDILFPELVQNEYVELDGHITRGNEKTNTIGFSYKGHILTCYPLQGKIVNDKSLFFTDCVIRGYVDRLDETGNYIESKPKIKYLDLVHKEENGENNLWNKS